MKFWVNSDTKSLLHGVIDWVGSRCCVRLKLSISPCVWLGLSCVWLKLSEWIHHVLLNVRLRLSCVRFNSCSIKTMSAWNCCVRFNLCVRLKLRLIESVSGFMCLIKTVSEWVHHVFVAWYVRLRLSCICFSLCPIAFGMCPFYFVCICDFASFLRKTMVYI